MASCDFSARGFLEHKCKMAGDCWQKTLNAFSERKRCFRQISSARCEQGLGQQKGVDDYTLMLFSTNLFPDLSRLFEVKYLIFTLACSTSEKKSVEMRRKQQTSTQVMKSTWNQFLESSRKQGYGGKAVLVTGFMTSLEVNFTICLHNTA